MVAFTEPSKDSTHSERSEIATITMPSSPADDKAKESVTSSFASLTTATVSMASSIDNLEKQSGSSLEESWYSTLIQVAVPFFLAGIGTIGAGLVLNIVQDWPVFKNVSGIMVLVPALLGLKGNLDMCLASRISTQANLGNTEKKGELLSMVVGNVALVQVQAIVAATIVSVFSVGVAAATSSNFQLPNAALLLASAVFTATTCCFILDFVMIGVVLIAGCLHCNPDNLATPLAASIGDVVSVSCLSFIASLIYDNLDTNFWIVYVIFGVYLVLLPIWILIVLNNKYTRHILSTGWTPVLSALFISGFGGLVLEKAEKYKGYVIFQPVINGIGGNLVSVQASRISTLFHQTSILGIIPPHMKTWVSPFKALFYGSPSANTARILLAMSIPGHMLFLFASDFISQNFQSKITPLFGVMYITVALLQLIFLLYTAHVMIHYMWGKKIDPDNSAIPYLTALGDLSGSSLLFLAFWSLEQFGLKYGRD